MISGEPLLIFGDEWGAYPTTTEHLLRPLVAQNPCLWAHMIGLRRPELNLYDLGRIWTKLKEWSGNSKSVDEYTDASKTGFIAPFSIPFNNIGPIRRFNRTKVISSVNRKLQAMGLSNPILITSSPHTGDVVGNFGERAVVYICEDEYSEMPSVFRDYARETEAKLLDRADLVFVTSKALLSSKSSKHKEAILLPQALDWDHFDSDIHKKTPNDIAGIPGPRIGFVGLLAPWVDIELIARVAKKYADASVIVIGPARTDISVLNAIKNVHVLGPRQYSEIPAYMRSFDVGLIPFQRNELTRFVNPLKLLEYMASGCPVVSTDLPDLGGFGNLVYSAGTDEDFVAAVGLALAEDSSGLREQRIAVAKANSWASRVETMCSEISAVLATKDYTCQST